MAMDVGGEADVEATSVITACVEARGWIKVMFSSSESDVSMDIMVAEIKAIVQLIIHGAFRNQASFVATLCQNTQAVYERKMAFLCYSAGHISKKERPIDSFLGKIQ